MKMGDLLMWRGRIKIITRLHRDPREFDEALRAGQLDQCDLVHIDVIEFDNLITDVGKNMLRDALRGTVTDAKYKYMGVGTNNTAPAVGQTQLVAESMRKAVTKQTAGATGVVVTTTYLSPADANITIAELGWFAGSAATATANSGIMVSRVLYSKVKTNVESIQVERTDTIA